LAAAAAAAAAVAAAAAEKVEQVLAVHLDALQQLARDGCRA
jgi:hypothetical protein